MNAPTRFDLRKDEIVKAAIPILNAKGIHGMTLALVAAQLDLMPRAVSYYFQRKEDLAAACFERSIALMESLVAKAAAQADAPLAIGAFVRAFFEFRRRVALGEVAEVAWFEDLRTLREQDVGQAYERMFRQVRTLFERPGAPTLGRNERNARAHQLLSQLLWAVLWLPRYNPEDYPRLADRQADILLQGLAAPGRAFAPAALTVPSDLGSGRPASQQAFLRAATELINENGYLGASVSKISARLNLTKGSFYHHNEAKNDVVEQCFEETWAILRAVQAAGQTGGADGLTSLASQSAHLVEGQVSGERLLLRTSALSAVPEEMRFRLLAGFDRTTFHFAGVVSDAIADGSVRPVDVTIAAQMIAGAINAASELHHWAPGISPAMAVDEYLRPLFTGLLV